ncbi:MAG: hypothetical protein WAX85_01855 [Minisyncoccia bacterium]
MQTLFTTTARLTLGLLICLCLFTTVYATDYAVLVNLPGVGATTNLTSYVPAIFKLSMGIAAAMAFAVLTFGGIVYATSDAISGKDDGKRYMENAIWGLLLVIGAYAILWTINPQILSFELTLKAPEIKAGASNVSDQGTPLDADQLGDDARIRSYLSTNGVSVNSPACTAGNTIGCTNVNALPPNAQAALIYIKANCSCSVVITGGTEGGHKSHGPNLAVVDLRADVNLNKYINGDANTPPNNTTIQKNVNGANVQFTFETTGGGTGGTSSGPHWHTVIN